MKTRERRSVALDIVISRVLLSEIGRDRTVYAWFACRHVFGDSLILLS